MTDKPKTPSETARALLTAAAERADHLVPLPQLPGAAAQQVVRSLLKSEWVAEVPAPTDDPAFAWRTGEDSAVMILQATALGLSHARLNDSSVLGSTSAAAMAETALGLASVGAHRAEPAAPAAATIAAAFPLDADQREQNNRHGGVANHPGAPTIEPVRVRASRIHSLREAAQGLLDVWDTMPHGDPTLVGAMNRAVAALRVAMGRGRETAAAFGPELSRRDTKQALTLALLHRDAGASGPQIAAAVGWALHTVRGFLAGRPRRGSRSRSANVSGRSGGTGRPGKAPSPSIELRARQILNGSAKPRQLSELRSRSH